MTFFKARPEGQCAGEESSRMHPSESSQCSTQTQCKWCHGLITHNPKPVRGCVGCSRASSPWHMGPCTFCCPLSPSLVLANTSQNQPSTYLSGGEAKKRHACRSSKGESTRTTSSADSRGRFLLAEGSPRPG